MRDIDPHLIYQSPEEYIDYITNQPEGQFFDRKEVKNDKPKQLEEARNTIIKCISAFTNAKGGIIVLGVRDSGEMKGLNHLSENERNSITQIIIQKLSNQYSQSKEWVYHNKKFLLIYAPEGRSGICRTIGKNSVAYIRKAANNLPLTKEEEERLIIARSQSFEQLTREEYDDFLININVLEIFKQRYLEEQGANYSYNNEDFLRTIGAIRKQNNRKMFTNAGLLFFGKNPGAFIPAPHIRILKYECEYKDFKIRGNPIFDRIFTGCLPDILEEIRYFINKGAFFKNYKYRDPEGSGIIDEPEFPLKAVEEVIVNAIIHRDYGMPTPIECSLFKDAFVVRSPGSFKQPHFVPITFTLDNIELEHFPRNPLIVQWAKTMRDENNLRFVLALREGYRSIRDRMKELGLPAPTYSTNAFTTVVLYNNYKEREARYEYLVSEDNINLAISNAEKLGIESNNYKLAGEWIKKNGRDLGLIILKEICNKPDRKQLCQDENNKKDLELCISALLDLSGYFLSYGIVPEIEPTISKLSVENVLKDIYYDLLGKVFENYILTLTLLYNKEKLGLPKASYFLLKEHFQNYQEFFLRN